MQFSGQPIKWIRRMSWYWYIVYPTGKPEDFRSCVAYGKFKIKKSRCESCTPSIFCPKGDVCHRSFGNHYYLQVGVYSPITFGFWDFLYWWGILLSFTIFQLWIHTRLNVMEKSLKITQKKQKNLYLLSIEQSTRWEEKGTPPDNDQV